MIEPLGVSIIVVNYNNEPFLAAAIDSALGQTYSLCEVIVVDDCSRDSSRAVIMRYRARIRSVFRGTNGGHIAGLNSAWPSPDFQSSCSWLRQSPVAHAAATATRNCPIVH
jgi:glycosyltransferase involved in cell wall biosynthesis